MAHVCHTCIRQNPTGALTPSAPPGKFLRSSLLTLLGVSIRFDTRQSPQGAEQTELLANGPSMEMRVRRPLRRAKADITQRGHDKHHATRCVRSPRNEFVRQYMCEARHSEHCGKMRMCGDGAWRGRKVRPLI